MAIIEKLGERERFFKLFWGFIILTLFFFPKVFWDFQFWTFFLSIFQKS